MPQNPIPILAYTNPGKSFVAGKVDAAGNILVASNAGNLSRLNITAAVAVKVTPGRIGKVVVVAPGSGSGALTLNDCAATGDAAAGNEILSIPFGSLTAGQVINLDWPCAVGIVVSAVPDAGSPVFSISYS